MTKVTIIIILLYIIIIFNTKSIVLIINDYTKIINSLFKFFNIFPNIFLDFLHIYYVVLYNILYPLTL